MNYISSNNITIPMHKKYRYNQGFYTGKMQHAYGGVIVQPPTDDPKINEYLTFMHKWFKTFTLLDVYSDNEFTEKGVWTRNKLMFSLFSQIDNKFCGEEMSSEYLWNSIYLKDEQKFQNNVIYKLASDRNTLHSALTFRFEKMEETGEYYIYIESFCTNNSAKKNMDLYLNAEKTPAELMREAGAGSALMYRIFDLCVFLGIRTVKLDAVATRETLESYKRMRFKKMDDSSIDVVADVNPDIVKIKHEISPSERTRVVLLSDSMSRSPSPSDTESDSLIRQKAKRKREKWELLPIHKNKNDGLYVDSNEIDELFRDFTQVAISDSPDIKKSRRSYSESDDLLHAMVHINPDEYMNYMDTSKRENQPRPIIHRRKKTPSVAKRNRKNRTRKTAPPNHLIFLGLYKYN